jgi:hypothetical protein
MLGLPVRPASGRRERLGYRVDEVGDLIHLNAGLWDRGKDGAAWTSKPA